MTEQTELTAQQTGRAADDLPEVAALIGEAEAKG